MDQIDLEPATTRLAALVRAIPDERLADPTPCEGMRLGALVDHVGGLSLAFSAAARKDLGSGFTDGQAPADPGGLREGWRERIPAALAEMAAAWRDPTAWQGTTRAGGVDLPGAVAGLVALDEVVVHGWDVARASGQPFDVEPGLLGAVHDFVRGFAGPGQDEARAGLFGPEVPVPPDAPLLDRVLGMTGRDPAWAPPR